jgi:DNA helicase-2/ATP-dependent DNA helicase PcrA
VADKFPVRGRKQPIELPDALIKEKLPPGDYQLMEERRLFYVGMTRAGRELYLTSSVDYGGKRDRKVSPFVLEALDLPKADIAVLKQPAAAQIELFGSAGPVPPRERKRGKDEIIPLSYYQIDDYLTCPLKYQYVHVLRVPLLPNHQILYGSAMHQAVQAYFLARKKRRKFSEKQLLDTFKNNWSSEGFISRQHEEQRFAAGKKALQKFYKAAAARKRIPRYVEEEFSALVGKVQLRGRWDLIEEGKGKTYIVDFKSSEVKEQKEADRRVKESLQLAIYALVWKEMFNSLPDFLELYFLETGMIGSVATDKAILEKTREKIQRVADGIRQANFRATPGFRACTYCPYNEVCPSSAV